MSDRSQELPEFVSAVELARTLAKRIQDVLPKDKFQQLLEAFGPDCGALTPAERLVCISVLADWLAAQVLAREFGKPLTRFDKLEQLRLGRTANIRQFLNIMHGSTMNEGLAVLRALAIQIDLTIQF